MWDNIREALWTVTVVCGIGGVLLTLCPEGKDGGMKKQVSLLLSLILCLGLLLPLRDAELSVLREALPVSPAETGKESARESALRLTEDNLEKQLSAVLREKYGIGEPSLRITFDRTETDPVSVISVLLKGDGDLTAGIAYLEEFLHCTVTTEEP